MAEILTVDTTSDFPITGQDGSIVYIQDIGRHFMWANAVSYEIPNLLDVNSAPGKSWVSGIEKDGSFAYFSKATTASGIATFYLTDNGLSTGNAVFNHVYADTITITPYGTSALYQMSSPTVVTGNKSITINVSQVTSVLLGLIQSTTAANGIDIRMLVMGD